VTLSEKQQGVLKGIVAGAGISIVGIVGAIRFGPEILDPNLSIGGRLEFVAKSDLAILIWLAISVGWLARHRFFTPEDIDGGGLASGTTHARVLQSALQNTLEQTVIAVTVHVAWAIVMPPQWLIALPIATALFILGRILFVRGYAHGAPARALGFALTFYPSLLLLLIIVGRLVPDLLA